MFIRIGILFVMLLVLFFILSKNGFLNSLVYTVFFIITVWINIPCFINISELKNITDNSLMFLFSLYNELGIIYIILANILLGIVMFLQFLFLNKSTYTYNEVKRKYDCFGEDADKLYVIGRDLDFLDKKEFKKQTDRIIHLGKRCKLLCESTNDKRLLDLYKKVYQQGVEIKFYTKNDNLTNLKGQIKIDHNGEKKAIFMSRKNKKYLLLNIENQFLVDSILERYNEVYKKSNTKL